jgi:hypothetical protein
MSDATESITLPPARAKHWFDRLPPRVRAVIVAAAVTAINTAVTAVWVKAFPGQQPPQLLPQSQPAVVVLSVGQPTYSTGLTALK